VIETPDALLVECELAGLERDRIEIRVDEQLLTVQGERARPEDQGDWTFHRLERPRGKFVRKFELPLGLDLDRVSAQLEGGVLRVVLPKRPEARARAVPVARPPGRDN
jgi:HSP20 family protein